MDLIKAWSYFDEKSRPYFLKEDKDVLLKEKFSKDVWKKQINNLDYLDPINKNEFQLGYLPSPFAGNLKKASIFILMLNPGFGPSDSYAENNDHKFRKAILASLKQTSNAYFYPLDPQFSWTGSFDYWHKKFEKLILKIQTQKGNSFSEARQFLAKHLASIEMIPYHRETFRGSKKFINNLPSADLARKFVKGRLLTRANNGEVLIVVTRKTKEWGLPNIKGKVINYTSGQARGAHLTPGSPGGDAIFDFLFNKK